MTDPRLDPNNPMTSPLLPDDDVPYQPAQTQYSMPPMPPEQRPYPAYSGQPGPAPIATTTDRGGPSGCTWLLGGLVGCMGLIGVLAAGLILVGGMTVDSLWRDVSGFFDFLGNAGRRGAVTIQVPEVERIQLLSELTTARFSYSGVVETAIDMPQLLQALYGDSQVMVAVVRIEAGIDLSNFSSEDLIYDAGAARLTMQLPAPRLRECFMDESQSYVVSRSTGLFAVTSPRLDSESRRFALAQFREQALEEGILAEAEERASTVMSAFAQLFVAAGSPVEEVLISFSPNDDAELPATCR